MCQQEISNRTDFFNAAVFAIASNTSLDITETNLAAIKNYEPNFVLKIF
jgi:hypothetical protein